VRFWQAQAEQKAREAEKLSAELQEMVTSLAAVEEQLRQERSVSGIHPGYSCKEGRRVEDELLLEFPCTPTRTRSM
jgi:hypothetical protein